MKIRDLIDELEGIAEEHGDDIDVRLAQQPQWAFEYAIDTVAAATIGGKYNESKETVAYIAEGRQIGYLPDPAAVAVEWREARDDEDDEEMGE